MPSRRPPLALPTLLVLATLLGCPPTTTEPAEETLDLPADPAENGVLVGVRTVTHEGTTMEIWYPASDDAIADGGSSQTVLDPNPFLPDCVREHLGEGGPTLPSWTIDAVRDAAPRRLAEPLPVVLYSHGLGAFRWQSPDLLVHLASRGYVVVSMDHPGRMLGDLLPLLFAGSGLSCPDQEFAVQHCR